MKKSAIILSLAIPLAGLTLAGCLEENNSAPAAKVTQAQRAAREANSIRFTNNSEIDNIKARVEITSDPGQLGYILLMNEAGQPILYEAVKGKITSGSKRLTAPDYVSVMRMSPNDGAVVRQAPSDEGTYGHSGEYIYYWNTDGTYRQWNGKYLYSLQPIRLRVEPLVISIAPAETPKAPTEPAKK